VGLDIRVPIGILFAVLGCMLVGFGVASDPAMYQRSLGINVNLWWGGALLLFGVVMLLLGRLRPPTPRQPSEPEGPAHRPAGTGDHFPRQESEGVTRRTDVAGPPPAGNV
jgi:hypothetical protein